MGDPAPVLLRGHAARVNGVAVSPDGRRFLLNRRAGSDNEPIEVITGWEGGAK